jgi:hypothetical protein
MSIRDSATALLVAAVLLAATLSGCGGTSSEPATPSTGDEPPSAAAEADENGATLDILSPDPASVLLDGKPIGKTPINRLAVAPGSHDVTFVDEARGNRTMVITVQPGEAATVKADAPPKKVKMTEPEPTESSE